jgi:hypothetical protein
MTVIAPSVDMEVIWARGQEIRAKHKEIASTPPLVRLWANNPAPDSDGLVLRGVATDSLDGKFPFKKNKAGTGQLRLRLDNYLARWLISIPNDSEAKKNVVISVEQVGTTMRWSGLLHHWTLRKDKDGIRYLEATFIDDLQFLTYLRGAPNPVLPINLFQWPRVFAVLGPSIWAISLLIWLNLLRYQGNLYNLPDDPFDFGSWIDPLDMNTWQVLIKAPTFAEDSSLWTLLASRMDAVDKSIEDALDDGQLVLRYRRIFTVDGETVDGIPGVTTPRNGVLVLEVVDRSGYFEPDGTGTSATAVDGFKRTVVAFADGFIEQNEVFVSDDESTMPPEYFLQNWFGTKPSHPWIVLRDRELSGIESAELSWAPATVGQIIVGGQNEYADAAVQLAIQVTGNMLSYFFLGGFSSGGDIAATAIMPLLRGTILAWNTWKSQARIDNLGWVHLMEMYQPGANNAWTLSAVAALRAGLAATKSTTGHAMQMLNKAPFIFGLHMQIGDRVGSTIAGTSDSIFTDPIFVEQIEEAVLSWDNAAGVAPFYELSVGTNKAAMSQAERSARLMSKALATLENLGVSLV